MEIWFYHLQRQPLRAALPVLLEKSAARGWRSVVQADTPARIDELDEALWTYARASFLPHARDGEGDHARQQVVLTLEPGNPNAAALRIFVGQAVPGAALDGEPGYERVIVLFDGNDEDELHFARGQWTALKAGGHQLAYWQQNERGGWDRRA